MTSSNHYFSEFILLVVANDYRYLSSGIHKGKCTHLNMLFNLMKIRESTKCNVISKRLKIVEVETVDPDIKALLQGVTTDLNGKF